MPAQDFVWVKGASSSLDDPAPVYTQEGKIPEAGFGALSLFDGIRETAWCEGVSGDGIGEWVEFELTKNVEGFEIQNGYNMSLFAVPGKDIDTYYGKNNRPKRIEIASLDGKIKLTIDLEDTERLQYFDARYLPKGRYRVYIRAVYKGSRWQDTCLGEITFHPAAPLFPQLETDAFFKEHAAAMIGTLETMSQ
jgi:hypothetical protein